MDYVEKIKQNYSGAFSILLALILKKESLVFAKTLQASKIT